MKPCILKIACVRCRPCRLIPVKAEGPHSGLQDEAGPACGAGSCQWHTLSSASGRPQHKLAAVSVVEQDLNAGQCHPLVFM
jgi:hypothetical protein